MFVLFAVSWRIYQAHRPVPSAGAAVPTALAPAAGSPVPKQSPPLLRAQPKPTPAARLLPSFPIDLGQLNRDQGELARAEEALLARMIRAIRGYLEAVVLPAVKRAESVSSATNPATTHSPDAIRKMS
jgi:hypothetical protein